MTEHFERAEIENRDPATTAILERIVVPEHAPDFWDELTSHMDETPPVTVLRPRRFTSPSTNRILLAAAVIIVLLLGSAVFVSLPDGSRTQPLDSGPVGDASEREPTTYSRIGGSDAEWFFGNQMVWVDGQFVAGFNATEPGQNDASHWTSSDGIDWTRKDGSTPALLDPFVCPAGFGCAVNPEIEQIPFHYAAPQYEVMARAGDTLLLRASVHYTIDGQDSTVQGQEQGVAPQLHPDLLAAAARFDPCFGQLDQAQPGNDDSPYLAEWGAGGIDDPVIRITCRQGQNSGTFVLDLREYLTDEQIEKVFSGGYDTELWVEQPGSPAVRVANAPSSAFWADGTPGNEIVQPVADIASSGDRFWAASNGAVVTSTDGINWAPVEVPSGDLQPTRIEASAGGNLALRLSTDSRDWSNDRWISISHDNGVTWSTPFEMPTEIGYGTAVGPAGAAVTSFSADGPDGPQSLSLVGEDGIMFSAALPSDSCCESVAVGEDRVLLRTNEKLDVYLLDGTLAHEALWSGDGGGWSLRWPGLPIVILGLTATAIGVVITDRIRSAKAAG